MIASIDQLGIGLYSPEQAAFYARVQARLLKRWIFGDGQGDSVIRPEIQGQESPEKTVTFLDLIQALAIRAIRNEFKIPLQKIRAAVDYAREHYGVEYPFATQHTTYLFSDQHKLGHGEILIRLPGVTLEQIEERYIQVSGKKRGNFVMREIVQVYLDDLQFGEQGLASEWKPMKSESDAVILNPHRLFGEPIISSCGHTAETLWEASVTEGGVDNAAKAFGVTVDAVKLACKFQDHLNNIAV